MAEAAARELAAHAPEVSVDREGFGAEGDEAHQGCLLRGFPHAGAAEDGAFGGANDG